MPTVCVLMSRSFGYGGGNAHCVLDDAYHYLKEHGLSGGHNTVIKWYVLYFCFMVVID
jgi:hypothetical protein